MGIQKSIPGEWVLCVRVCVFFLGGGWGGGEGVDLLAPQGLYDSQACTLTSKPAIKADKNI